MSYRGRELECKLLVTDPQFTLFTLNLAILACWSERITRSVFATSTDTYWALTSPAEGQFIRARNIDGQGDWQITVKGVDRESNLDRRELECRVGTNPVNMLRLAHGKPVGKIEKQYYVHWIDGSEHTNISCYQVKSHELELVIEVESTSLDMVQHLREKIERVIDVKEAPGSLYEMLLLEGGSPRSRVLEGPRNEVQK